MPHSRKAVGQAIHRRWFIRRPNLPTLLKLRWPRHFGILSKILSKKSVIFCAPMYSYIRLNERQGMVIYSPEESSTPTTLMSEDVPVLQQQLSTLGFTAAQSRNAVAALSQASPITTSLLSALSPLQACLEYLVLHVPECDLPRRFLPSDNSSNPFISSTHSGTDDLKRRWVEDKAVKECGWPAHVVQECMLTMASFDDWGALVSLLNYRLIGDALDPSSSSPAEDVEVLDAAEVEGWNGRFFDPTHLVLPMPVAPIELHVILSSDRCLPTQGRPPPMYITSASSPAYIRLHLLSRLLSAFKDSRLLEPGETFLMGSMRLLEEEWARIEDEGPPEVSGVLQHLLPRKVASELVELADDQASSSASDFALKKKGGPRRTTDPRSNAEVRANLEAIHRDLKFKEIQATRQKLPASSAEQQFLDLLKKNQCVVVVGETGEHYTPDLREAMLTPS